MNLGRMSSIPFPLNLEKPACTGVPSPIPKIASADRCSDLPSAVIVAKSTPSFFIFVRFTSTILIRTHTCSGVLVVSRSASISRCNRSRSASFFRSKDFAASPFPGFDPAAIPSGSTWVARVGTTSDRSRIGVGSTGGQVAAPGGSGGGKSCAAEGFAIAANKMQPNQTDCARMFRSSLLRASTTLRRRLTEGGNDRSDHNDRQSRCTCNDCLIDGMSHVAVVALRPLRNGRNRPSADSFRLKNALKTALDAPSPHSLQIASPGAQLVLPLSVRQIDLSPSEGQSTMVLPTHAVCSGAELLRPLRGRAVMLAILASLVWVGPVTAAKVKAKAERREAPAAKAKSTCRPTQRQTKTRPKRLRRRTHHRRRRTPMPSKLKSRRSAASDRSRPSRKSAAACRFRRGRYRRDQLLDPLRSARD